MADLIFDQKARVGEWVARQVGQSASWGDFYAMGLEQDGEIVAGIVFNGFNKHNATAHIAVSKPSRMFLELLEHAAGYAFNQCGLKRLTGLVEMSNTKAMALDRHIGWEEEFVMRSAAADGGDLQVFVLWPDKCRWLKRRVT